MFEESNQNATYTDRIFGRMKLVVATFLADGSNWALVASASSPGLATTNGGTTIAVTGAPKSSNYWFTLPEGSGAITASVNTWDATAGTFTITASGVTASALITIFFLANRTG